MSSVCVQQIARFPNPIWNTFRKFCTAFVSVFMLHRHPREIDFFRLNCYRTDNPFNGLLLPLFRIGDVLTKPSDIYYPESSGVH